MARSDSSRPAFRPPTFSERVPGCRRSSNCALKLDHTSSHCVSLVFRADWCSWQPAVYEAATTGATRRACASNVGNFGGMGGVLRYALFFLARIASSLFVTLWLCARGGGSFATTP